MKYRLAILVASSVLAFCACTSAPQPSEEDDKAAPEATERLTWRKTPMAIELPVGTERLVHFPGAVKVGVPLLLLTYAVTLIVTPLVFPF